ATGVLCRGRRGRAVIVLGLIAIPVLVLVNGFFVAVEFALVAVRKTRVEELVRQGARGARSVSNAVENLNRSIAAAQLGITLASIALGAVGQSVLAVLLGSVLTFVPEHMAWVTRHSIATLLSIALITYVHVILGEQVPKMMAIQSADSIALWSARPLNLFARVTLPVLRLMNWTGNLVLRAMGYRPGDGPEQVHSVEELQMLVEDTEEAGLLEAQQAEFLKNVFRLTDKKVRDCMVPKEKMDALEVHTKTSKVLEVVRRSGHTRLPIYEETVDNIVGILNTKHLFSILTLGQVVILEDALYPATFIDPDESISVALQLFRKSRRPMAIVRDQEKRVLGMLTLEDVLEEIVGDIQDEHDEGAPRAVRPPVR
ncbi:MAG: HlyC/CorC family transporter, partial [Zavarzinella sp.]|nr:HlyC/CorC family transporter [Zavarzinella sp.]